MNWATRTLAVTVVMLECLGQVHADFLPGGYSDPTLVSGQTSDFLNISQLAFNPSDPNHLYAARFNFGWANGFITRYDFDPASGNVNHPVTIAAVPGASLGLAFHNNDLYVATADGNTGLGGIFRYQPTENGAYGNAVEFINNVPVGLHSLDHLQIWGNTLYVGIGTKTDTGINNTQGVQESVYNGTIGVIADVTKSDYSANGASNLPLANVLTDPDPGKLHVFASGFRNPFGVLVTAGGQVWVSDNGSDVPVTPDLLYKGLMPGDKGVFPTLNPGNLVSPFANLGLHTAATGLATVPLGANQGDMLVGLFHHDLDDPAPTLGNEVVLIDHLSGTVIPSLSSLTSVTDILSDPSGKILIADFGPNFDNGGNPNSGGIFLLAPEVPEPTSAMQLLLALAILGTMRLRSGRSR